MNLSEEITHCEQQLVKLEVQLAKEQATQLAMREKYAALEITVSEKAFYDSNRYDDKTYINKYVRQEKKTICDTLDRRRCWRQALRICKKQ